MHHLFINVPKKLMMLYLSLFLSLVLFACTASDYHNTELVKPDND